ncbi:MAG: xanthine dehydrogenase small subunit [Steroidobacteraceae bacterium]
MTADQHDGASNAIRFVLDGRVVIADHLPPTTTVLEYLRETAHRTGTKEGCAEGDCGACTVVLGELAADGSRVGYRAINSCIRFLPTIDGCELVTVESLPAPDGALHPVQQAMVDHHASQCGFCTPGFVMSLFALYLQLAEPDREQVLEALSGNLCRCTGYRPIIDAGCRMGGYPPPAHWSRDAATSPARRAALLAIRRDASLRLPGFHAPRTVDELGATLQNDPAALVLAGGTDVGLWVTKQLRELPAIVYIGEVAQLKRVRRDAAGIVVGAAVPLTDAWSAILADYPELAEQAQRFGSPPVRNSGTLCGNLANGSPIGDCLPILMALGAELELRRGTRTRRVPLERFYLGYQQKDLEPGEFIAAVTVPARSPRQWVASYKLSKRIDQDISAISAAFVMRVEDGQVAAARIAYGGMAAVAARAGATESALIGAAWNRSSIDAAAARLAVDFQPLTDLRASGAYRLQAAGNLLRRFYLAHGDSQPTRTAHAAAASALNWEPV